MFQLKFCLKTFEICSLSYVSVLTVAFQQLFCLNISNDIQGLRGTEGPKVQKNSRRGGCPLLPTPMISTNSNN